VDLDVSKVKVSITCDVLQSAMVVILQGREAINELTDLRVELRCKSIENLQDILGKVADLSIVDGSAERILSLWVSEVELIEEEVRAVVDGETIFLSQYALRLRPVLAALLQGSGYRMFAKVPGESNSSTDIILRIFEEYGFADLLELRLMRSYAERTQCVQYDENDLSFVERLLADEGISFWFEQIDGLYKMVVADSLDQVKPMIGEGLLFCDPSANVADPHLFALELVDQVCIEKTQVDEFDVRQPTRMITGEAGETSGCGYHYDYPGRVLNDQHARDRAKVRLEQLARSRSRAKAQSTSLLVQPGATMKVRGVADDLDAESQGSFNGTYFILSVEHDWLSLESDAGLAYSNRLALAQPHHFVRPSIPVWPSIASIEQATTTGSEDIVVNDLGEVRLSFPWDRSGVTDENSSWWARTLQFNMGGSMMLPRVGWEVPVMYHNGNPDRPVVMGRLYNPKTPLPYSLPEHKMTTALKGESVPGGGAHNEMRFGDTAGDEQVLINAVKDYSHFVGGGRTTKISQEMSESTGESRIVKVQTEQTKVVGAEQELVVGNELTTVVSETRKRLVGGLESYDVQGNMTLKTGIYTEAIGGLYGLQCNQHNALVLGSYVQAIGGNANYVCGLGLGVTVAGGRLHNVGGSLKIKCKKKYDEVVLGSKTLKTGSCKVKAGSAISNSCAGSATIAIGGSLKLHAKENAIFEAQEDLVIDVGELLTPHGSMRGGKLTSSKGKLRGSGSVVWKGGSEIETG